MRPSHQTPLVQYCAVSRRVYCVIDTDDLAAIAKGRAPLIKFVGNRRSSSKLQLTMADQLHRIFAAATTHLKTKKDNNWLQNLRNSSYPFWMRPSSAFIILF